MYKGIVKVYYEQEYGHKSDGVKQSDFSKAIKQNPKPNGMVMEVTVTAKTQASLAKKINAMLSTLDEDDD